MPPTEGGGTPLPVNHTFPPEVVADIQRRAWAGT